MSYISLQPYPLLHFDSIVPFDVYESNIVDDEEEYEHEHEHEHKHEYEHEHDDELEALTVSGSDRDSEGDAHPIESCEDAKSDDDNLARFDGLALTSADSIFHVIFHCEIPTVDIGDTVVGTGEIYTW